MAITGSTLSEIQGALKRFYLGPIRNQLNNATVLLSRLQRNEEDVNGDTLTARVPLVYERNQGVGARADGGSLPTARSRKVKQTAIPLAYNYGRIEVTGPAIAGSRNASGAFMKVIDFEIKGMVEGIKVDVNRQLFGDGTGYLCQVNGTSTGTTVTVDTPGTDYLEDGMYIDTITGGAVSVSASSIASVASATQFTLDTAATMTDNYYIVRTGSYNVEMMGLKGIIDDTTYTTTLQGITKSAGNDTWFRANVLDNGGTNRALTLNLMQQASDEAEKKGGRISLIVSNFELRRKYADLLVADKRFVNQLRLNGGFSALEYSAGGEPIPYVVDKHAIKNTLMFVDESTLALYRASDFDWMDDDGNILSRVSGYDAYEAILYVYMNLGCTAPNHSTVLRDVTQT